MFCSNNKEGTSRGGSHMGSLLQQSSPCFICCSLVVREERDCLADLWNTTFRWDASPKSWHWQEKMRDHPCLQKRLFGVEREGTDNKYGTRFVAPKSPTWEGLTNVMKTGLYVGWTWDTNVRCAILLCATSPQSANVLSSEQILSPYLVLVACTFSVIIFPGMSR